MAHYLNGGIRVQTPGSSGSRRRSRPTCRCCSACSPSSRPAEYWLQRYELTFSTRGTVDGATYTDVNVQLPAIYLLMLISLFAFGLFIVNIWRRGWVLPVLAVGLWVLRRRAGRRGRPVVRAAVPGGAGRVLARSAPYIGHNIAATRAALRLGGGESKPFDFDGEDRSRPHADQRNADTLRNIRLLGPDDRADDTYQQAAGRSAPSTRSTTSTSTATSIDGKTTQVIVAARDLNRDRHPAEVVGGAAPHLHPRLRHGRWPRPTTSPPTASPVLLAEDVPVTGRPRRRARR